jgi:hypothetical protein
VPAQQSSYVIKYGHGYGSHSSERYWKDSSLCGTTVLDPIVVSTTFSESGLCCTVLFR